MVRVRIMTISFVFGLTGAVFGPFAPYDEGIRPKDDKPEEKPPCLRFGIRRLPRSPIPEARETADGGSRPSPAENRAGFRRRPGSRPLGQSRDGTRTRFSATSSTTRRTSPMHHLPFGLVSAHRQAPAAFSLRIFSRRVDLPLARKSLRMSSSVYPKQ
jgi:hypothetical protein